MDVIRVLWCAAEGCGQSFLLCQKCYRGDKYCSTPCRRRARRAQNDAAQKQYLSKLAGRKRRAAASAAYRVRRQAGRHQGLPGRREASSACAKWRRESPWSITAVGGGRTEEERQIDAGVQNVIERTIPPRLVAQYGWPSTVRCGRCGRIGRAFDSSLAAAARRAMCEGP